MAHELGMEEKKPILRTPKSKNVRNEERDRKTV